MRNLEFVKVAAPAVCDFDLLFALILGNAPLKRSVTNALQHTVEDGEIITGFNYVPQCVERLNRRRQKA